MSETRCWICKRTEQEVEDEIGYIIGKDSEIIKKNMFHCIANKDEKTTPNVPLYFCRACGIIIDHVSEVTVKRQKP